MGDAMLGKSKVSFWLWFEVVAKMLVMAVLLGIIWITLSKSVRGDKRGDVESHGVKKGHSGR